MTRVIFDPKTNATRPYPRSDDKPIKGLDPSLVILTVIHEEPPEIPEGYSLKASEPVDDLEAKVRRIGWTLIPPQPPEPDVRSFYKALISSNLYLNKLAPLMFSPEPTWVGEPFSIVDAAVKNLLLGITQAPSPLEPEPSLQSSLWSFVALGFAVNSLDAADVQEVEGLMAIHGLTGVYSLMPATAPK